MSSRVTVNGKVYHHDPGAPFMRLHRPQPDEGGRCVAVVDLDKSCRRPCFFVVTGRSPEGERDGYWRHAPDTFWTSR